MTLKVLNYEHWEIPGLDLYPRQQKPSKNCVYIRTSTENSTQFEKEIELVLVVETITSCFYKSIICKHILLKSMH